MPTILVTDGLAEEGLRLLREQAQIVESPQIEPDHKPDAWIVRGRTRVAEAALGTAGEQLKVIGRAGVGVDNIDLIAAKARGVTVVNAPDALTVAVAELTIGLMLSLARRIPYADATMRMGEWRKPELVGWELSGKTLGIIGVGRIGAAVAERAGALGMRALGHDAYLSEQEIEGRGAKPMDLEPLLAESDVVCLHLPLTDRTRGMLGWDAFERMKPGVYLVSAARGGIIDEAALLEALEAGRVAGAALDVFAEEPPSDPALSRHPNVVSTPHIGAQTAEAQARAAADIAAEVLAALNGEPLRWKVV